MKSIVVGSSESYSGKSAVCLGIALNYVAQGLKVGFMKPVGNLVTDVDGVLTDEDVKRMKQALRLDDPLELMSPVLLTEDLVHDALAGKCSGLKDKVRKAFKGLSEGKDLLLLEGAGDIQGGSMLDLTLNDVAELNGSKIMLVSRYDHPYGVDRILGDAKCMRNDSDFIGVILNDVRPQDMDKVSLQVIPFLEGKGIPVLGTVPRDKALRSVTVKEVVGRIGGQVLVCEDKIDTVVESFLIGAMSPENALKYFRKLSSAALITGGDRSDIHLAALEANVNCLILTGNLKPSEAVLVRAEELGVPVVLVEYDTLTAVQKVDEVMSRIWIMGGDKIERIRDLVKENVDLGKIAKELGM